MSPFYVDYYLIQTRLKFPRNLNSIDFLFTSCLFFFIEYLLKIPNLKILRVYSDQIEQAEFPVPNKLRPPRATRSEDEFEISSEKVKCLSLHHAIRGPVCPFSQELLQYEEVFENSKAKKESIDQKEVNEYCKVGGNMKLLMKRH